MDTCANLDNVVNGMEWKDTVSTYEDVIQGQMRDTSNPPPPPPIHLGLDTHPQPGDSQTRGFGGCNLVGEASSVCQQQAPLLKTLSTIEPAHLYSQEGTVSQVQDCNIPVIPEGMVQYLHPVGYTNDIMVCDFAPAAPPLNNSSSKKGKCPAQQDVDHSYIKKPSNAFMLFLKEESPKVVSELSLTKSAAVNAIVGQRDCNIPVIPEDMVQYLRPVGYMNNTVVCDFAPAAPPLNNSSSIKGKCSAQQDADHPYIKKPPNAYMFFLKEESPKVVSELSLTKSAAVNAIVGQKDCNIPVIPEDMVQYLRPVGYLNDIMVCDFAPAAPPLNNSSSKKRKRPAQQDVDHPYIKKPPNAFMLFLKEQRPKVVSELNLTESAAVNAIVGQRWKSLSKDQQAKYYQQADKERRLHAQQHPDWSTKDNYGKKRKRVRRRTLAAASKPEEVTSQLLSLTALPQHLSSPHTDLFTGPQAHQGWHPLERRQD